MSERPSGPSSVGGTPVIVRAATRADVEAIQSIYLPIVKDTAISFEESPPDPAEIARRMLAKPRLPWLVADHASHVVGYTYASQHRQRPAYRWSADCSIYLGPEHRSRGLGRLLYERLIAEVRELGYVSLFAGITLPNEASVGLHEVVGFEAVGVFRPGGYKHGCWYDVGWWQRSLRDPPVPPAGPREWRPKRPVRRRGATPIHSTAGSGLCLHGMPVPGPGCGPGPHH